jgi:hypothetical protein
MVKEKKRQKICIIVQPQEALIIYAERRALGMKQNNIIMNIKIHCISIYEVSSYPHFSQLCFFIVEYFF